MSMRKGANLAVPAASVRVVMGWRGGAGVPDADCSALQVVPIDLVPDLPAPLHDLAGLRRGLALTYARGGGALVECEPIELDLQGMGGLPSNVADRPEYDAQFPQHPLTRLRLLLARMQATARVGDSFRNLPPFPGPQ